MIDIEIYNLRPFSVGSNAGGGHGVEITCKQEAVICPDPDCIGGCAHPKIPKLVGRSATVYRYETANPDWPHDTRIETEEWSRLRELGLVA
jgi:hypothetical protein